MGLIMQSKEGTSTILVILDPYRSIVGLGIPINEAIGYAFRKIQGICLVFTILQRLKIVQWMPF